MSKYKPLYSSIWTDNHFENYSPEKKLIYIFLLTNQYVEKSGIYKISIRQISFNTGVINDIINDVINELINEGKIQYDFKEGIIFIKNLFKYQKGMIKNENILLLTIKRNYELIKTEFWNEFFDVYSNDSLASKINDLLIDGSLMAHQLYINKDINKNKNKNKNDNNVESKLELELESQFESFWNLYDYKKAKPKAKLVFKSSLKKDSFENIIEGLNKYLKTRGSDRQYWKHPTTWLNGECWNDDYQTKQTQIKSESKKISLADDFNKFMGYEFCNSIKEDGGTFKVNMRSPHFIKQIELSEELTTKVNNFFINKKFEMICL